VDINQSQAIPENASPSCRTKQGLARPAAAMLEVIYVTRHGVSCSSPYEALWLHRVVFQVPSLCLCVSHVYLGRFPAI